MLPSRMRPESLQRSVESLMDLARDASQVEVIVVADADDNSTAYAARSLGCRVLRTRRHGYAALHNYYNYAARVSRGDYLILWNDDAVMQTCQWDWVLTSIRPTAWVANLQSQHSPVSCFPAVRREFYTTLGHLSLNTHVDSWIQAVARQVGVDVEVPIYVDHQNAGVTGAHEDDTRRDALRVVEQTQAAFGSSPMRQARDSDAALIRRASADRASGKHGG